MARRASTRLPAGKFDGVDTAPLFDVAATEDAPPARKSESRARRPRALGYAACPECTSGARGVVAIDLQGSHSVWREHVLTTWSGARLPCRASGVRLCAAPARHDLTEAVRCVCSR